MGRTGIHVSEIGFGAWAIGGNAHGNSYGPTVDADHDLLKALEQWVEHGVAPEKIIATHYINNNATAGIQFQRPLCPFPQVAEYKGIGDPTSAASFKCIEDEHDRDPRDQNIGRGLADRD